MDLVTKSPFYEISVNKMLNRIYLTLTGEWENDTDVSEFSGMWAAAVDLIRPQFTVALDARNESVARKDTPKIKPEVIRISMQAGMLGMAEVLNVKELKAARKAANAGKSVLPLISYFSTMYEAERWLNEISMREKG